MHFGEANRPFTHNESHVAPFAGNDGAQLLLDT